ncbi:MAG: hypothetical protein JJ939_16035 [Alphaproteobacteria bacterium]|nr:hypothetical protein [Alphaproteobacteria bacterium]MBO6629924.1 hypothetical protein [Alphaproteobacteria bacterium]
MSKDSGNSTQKMSCVDVDSGPAVAGYLAKRFPDNPVKRVGQLLPTVSTRTIEGWLQGKRPNGTHMDLLVSLFGFEFVKSVWGAVIEPLDQFEAGERLKNVEQEIAALRQALLDKDNKDQGQLPFV